MHDLLQYCLQYVADNVGTQPVSPWESLFSTHYPQTDKGELVDKFLSFLAYQVRCSTSSPRGPQQA